MASHPLERTYSEQHYSKLSEERFQTKSKHKGKSPKDGNESQTDASHQNSSRTDMGSTTPNESSRSSTTMKSKASRKSRTSLHSRKHGKNRSLARHFVDPSVEDEKEVEKPPEKPYSPFLNLYCPVCSNPDCILNKVATCRMLKEDGNEECKFCCKNCSCNSKPKTCLPISGLVPRDQYGVAITLLKENGGPIENSQEYTNRRRWCVPSTVSWNHQLDNWLTAYNQKKEDIKAESAINRAAQRKSITLKKKLHESSNTDSPSKGTLLESRADDDAKPNPDEMVLILEGQGFKIFKKGNEKILMNYDRNNCKHLGCNCIKTSPKTNFIPCGCKDRSGNSPDVPHQQKATRKSGISLMKETPDGLIEIDRSEVLGRNRNEVSEVHDDSPVDPNLKRGSNAEVKLQARDLMHRSRSEIWSSVHKDASPRSDE